MIDAQVYLPKPSKTMDRSIQTQGLDCFGSAQDKLRAKDRCSDLKGPMVSSVCEISILAPDSKLSFKNTLHCDGLSAESGSLHGVHGFQIRAQCPY